MNANKPKTVCGHTSLAMREKLVFHEEWLPDTAGPVRRFFRLIYRALWDPIEPVPLCCGKHVDIQRKIETASCQCGNTFVRGYPPYEHYFCPSCGWVTLPRYIGIYSSFD